MTAIKLSLDAAGKPVLVVDGRPAPIDRSSYQLSAVTLAESLADAMSDGIALEQQAAAMRRGVKPQPNKLVTGLARLESLAERLGRLPR